MHYQKLKTLVIYIMSILIYGYSYCDSYNNIDNKMNDLMKQINTIDAQINMQVKKKTDLDMAIKNSNIAINKTNNFIVYLLKKKDLTKSQLEQLKSSLKNIQNQCSLMSGEIKLIKTKLYYQLEKLQSQPNSIINDNNKNTNIRNKVYLIQILVAAQKKYMILESKVVELDKANEKLQLAILSIEKNIIQYKEMKDKLVKQNKFIITNDKNIYDTIYQEKNQIIKLELQRKALNKLLHSLSSKSENKDNLEHQHSEKIIDSKQIGSNKLINPMQSKPFVLFGQLYNKSNSNGFLYKSNNENVYSISNGIVKYTGELPGFGSVIVIDYKNNYVAIYAGIITKVKKKQQVVSGQIIASSGSSVNQPMGGVYFELRHWGVPVNPNNLIK